MNSVTFDHLACKYTLLHHVKGEQKVYDKFTSNMTAEIRSLHLVWFFTHEQILRKYE